MKNVLLFEYNALFVVEDKRTLFVQWVEKENELRRGEQITYGTLFFFFGRTYGTLYFIAEYTKVKSLITYWANDLAGHSISQKRSLLIPSHVTYLTDNS